MLFSPLLALAALSLALCWASTVPIAFDELDSTPSYYSASASKARVATVIKSRQTSKEAILRRAAVRATRKLSAPRAFSSTSPNGFTGSTFVLQRTGTGSYIGQATTTDSFTQGYTLQTATRFKFDSKFRIVTASGGLIMYSASNTAGPSAISADTETTIAGTAAKSILTCKIDSSRLLSCSRFTTATAGTFCLNVQTTAANPSDTTKTIAGFGNTCTQFRTLSLTEVDV